MKQDSVETILNKVIDDLRVYIIDKDLRDPLFIGIRTGGVWLVERIHQALHGKEPFGVLDISFYRDDFSRIGLHPFVKPSEIPFEIENRHIILVDDVLQTGRTIRAAMNEIFDYGRPASITLVCLVELSGQELPIRPNIVGTQLFLPANQCIKLLGPDKLELVTKAINKSE